MRSDTLRKQPFDTVFKVLIALLSTCVARALRRIAIKDEKEWW